MTPEPDSPAPRDTDVTSTPALNFTDTFPHLERAPIVEAVIDFRAPAAVALEEQAMRQLINEPVANYPKVTGKRLVENELTAEAGKSPKAIARDLGFVGLECRTADDRQVVQFYKDGFAFSRLHPYQQWDVFVEEAMRLWDVHLKLAQPEEVKRVGVRFINQMQFPLPCPRLEDYLTAPPFMPPQLPLPHLITFFHQELRAVPATPYAMNVTKTTQPVERASGHFTLILDVDVFMALPMKPNGAILREHLSKMRWLKNKAFFANLTQKAIERFQ